MAQATTQEKISGAKKAAIVLLTLGKEAAAKIMKGLKESDIEKNNKIYAISRKHDGSSSLKITEDNKELKFHRINQAQLFINDILNMPYDEFINFSVFDTLKFEDLSSLSLADFRKLLRSIFKFETFNSISEDVILKYYSSAHGL